MPGWRTCRAVSLRSKHSWFPSALPDSGGSASTEQFIPELPGWRERSPFIRREGRISFNHYDLHAQALAKIERGHERDPAILRCHRAPAVPLPLHRFEVFPPLLRGVSSEHEASIARFETSGPDCREAVGPGGGRERRVVSRHHDLALALLAPDQSRSEVNRVESAEDRREGLRSPREHRPRDAD